MIPEPTTPEQAVQNAIEAARMAHGMLTALGNTKMMITVGQADQLSQTASAWAATANAWSRIADQLPEVKVTSVNEVRDTVD